MNREIELNGDRKVGSIFLNKSFMLLFLGKLVSQLGDVIYNMAIGWYILTITQSAVQMSFYMAFGTIIYVVMSPFGGVIADRYNRKNLMVWMDIIRGISVAIIGILMFFKIESILLLYLSSFILSICGAIFVPASNSLVPSIVEEEHLTKANSLTSSVNSLSNIFGLVAGGALYALLGIKFIFIFNAVSYILSGISEMFIEYKNKINIDKREEKHFIRELLDTFKYIKNQRPVFIVMMAATLINFILVPVFAVYLPYIFNQIAKTSALEYSYVGAAESVGFLLGAAIISSIPQRDKINGYLKIGMIVYCLLIFVAYLVVNSFIKGYIVSKVLVTIFVITALLLGVFSSIMNIPFGVFIQRRIPNELLGRVSAMLNTLSMAAMPLGMLFGGALADIIPMNLLLLATSIVLAGLTISLFFIKEVNSI
ncbi:MFS transporter [Caloramator proteoclasticus]|uniref:Predicted arabinose efflux permease, MFS family n=1 Tax=Caloramator proteoclasticus DSM 10124 TaxID=1121262 RepID=A0A1M5A247_9CLOT|nr:MFS transporter [Caloramator proteoclasticus]SHF23996.1 Predicted arabinose efflux permease, MFS family [Caloramator proteoclasticus DSM 10124]